MHWFFCLAFRAQNNTVESVRHDCVSCTHLPDICRVLSVLQMQILGICFFSDRENVDWKTFSIPFWFCFVPPLCFITIPYSSCVIYFMFHHREKSSNHFIPVESYSFIHHIILALCIRSCILCASYLSRIESSSPFYVIYLCPLDMRGGRSVLAQHLSTGLHTYVCM